MSIKIKHNVIALFHATFAEDDTKKNGLDFLKIFHVPFIFTFFEWNFLCGKNNRSELGKFLSSRESII